MLCSCPIFAVVASPNLFLVCFPPNLFLLVLLFAIMFLLLSFRYVLCFPGRKAVVVKCPLKVHGIDDARDPGGWALLQNSVALSKHSCFSLGFCSRQRQTSSPDMSACASGDLQEFAAACFYSKGCLFTRIASKAVGNTCLGFRDTAHLLT